MINFLLNLFRKPDQPLYDDNGELAYYSNPFDVFKRNK